LKVIVKQRFLAVN